MPARLKYHFCWWCSRQLWGKRLHVTMQSTANVNADVHAVIVHHGCAEEMRCEGGWEPVIEAA